MNKSNRVFVARSVAMLLVALCASGCGGGGSKGASSSGPTLQSIAVTPASPAIPAAVTAQLVATGTYSDGSSHDVTATVTWTSGAATVATITSGGLATAVAAGSSLVSATS